MGTSGSATAERSWEELRALESTDPAGSQGQPGVIPAAEASLSHPPLLTAERGLPPPGLRIG